MSNIRRKITVKEIPLVKAALLKRQEFQCPLCEDPLTIVLGCLDHDHRSGLIRGVLCRNCNGIEGKIYNLVNRAKRTSVHKNWLGRVLLYWIKNEVDHTGLYHPTYKTKEEKRVRTNARARKRRALAHQQ